MFIVRNIGINCSFVDVTPFELFQTDKKVLVINDPKEINVILEMRYLPEEYRVSRISEMFAG